MSERYKRALDAGVNAASKYRAYISDGALDSQGTGFGIGKEDSGNVHIDRQECLKWFYRLFFRNLSIYDKDKQDRLKKYMPMKAVICYDRLMIADAEDNWNSYDLSGEKEYIILFEGRQYKFTLSNQIYDIARGLWIRSEDIGLGQKERKRILTQYIINELNSFMVSRGNKESGADYKIVFSIDDEADTKLSGINGVNFLVFCEGLPLPSLNPFKQERFYAYSIGGSEIIRE
ncbi:MAG TPA: hypothetical protein VD757_01935 [Candidatus Nitrosocosmicus sp.]|nr:hypothetical protein [Candidatus Nitrosocosmicus sp.]